MHIDIDWHEECLEYRRDQGLGEEDLASRAALTLRLAGLMQEYNRLTEGGRHDEAARLVQWLVVPTDFVLTDPDTGYFYECIHSPVGDTIRIRVVAGYAPEPVDLEPKAMPEATITE